MLSVWNSFLYQIHYFVPHNPLKKELSLGLLLSYQYDIFCSLLLNLSILTFQVFPPSIFNITTNSILCIINMFTLSFTINVTIIFWSVVYISYSIVISCHSASFYLFLTLILHKKIIEFWFILK